MIVLDTSVLWHVFRRPAERLSDSTVVSRYRALVEDGAPLAVPGIVFQEILSGVRGDIDFERLRHALAGFPLILAEAADHLDAARLMNRLRGHGIAASSVDTLIAAIAIRRDASLFTLDGDFERFSRLIPLRVFPL